MVTKKGFENTQKLLKKYCQEHLLAFWQELNPAQRQNLLTQINELDFSKIDHWLANLVKQAPSAPPDADLAPAESYGPNPANTEQQRKYTRAIKLGKKLIAAGNVAAFVVAGGQGTRLGLEGPKGNFPVSPIRNKTLFQLFAETIAAAANKYQTHCPWYIMTSPLNHAQTVEIFRKNGYYGLDQKDVSIFEQGTLPNFASDGKILLADKANIARSPDGHGGSLKALHRSGALEDMKKRSIEFISYWQVDNPLVNIFDPLFIGLHALDESEISSKALIKTGPYEKVGNFCLLDGKINVIEYSDLPDELAEKQNPDGSLAFQLGSIAIHIISRTFVEKLNTTDLALPLHRAVKKIPHIDRQGNPIEADGIKLESFIFDAVPLALKSIILQTLRAEEFAPIKNASGTDSAESSRQMMLDRATRWLQSAGVSLPPKELGGCLIEIAPGFALQKEDVAAKLSQIPPIKPGDKIYLD